MYNTKIRQDLLDQDYIHKLSEKEKDWLDRFNKEFVNATFEKSSNQSYSKNNLHKGEKNRKQLYSQNYKRNNCSYNVAKVTNNILPLETVFNRSQNGDVEDALIEVIDAKNYVNALEKESLNNLAKSKRRHSTIAILRKKANNRGNQGGSGPGNK